MLKTKTACDRFHVEDGKTVSKTPVFNEGLPGLKLTARRTAKGETKSWSIALRGLDKTLGLYAAYSLDEARAWHREQYRMHKEGIPTEPTATEKNIPPATLHLLFSEWVETKCPEPSRPGRRGIWRKHCQPLHDLPVSDLNWQLIYNHVEKMGEPTNAGHRIIQTVNAMALLLFNRYGIGSNGGPIPLPPKLSTIFDRRKTNEVIARKRDVTIPAERWRELWHQLIDTPSQAALKVLMLTGCRKTEASAMDWSEVDLEAKTWTLPAERSKTRVAKVYPLPPLLVDLLKHWEITRQFDKNTGLPCGLVFGSIGRNTINHALERLLGKGSGYVVHDLRRTFATLCGEHVTSNVLIIDKMLNHAPPSRLIGIYQPKHLEAEEAATWRKWHIWSDAFL